MKRLSYTTCLMLVFLVFSFAAEAQRKRLPAFLVTTSLDTVNGHLLFENQGKRLRSIQFDDGKGVKTYEAATIQAYGIGDSLYYESREVFIQNERQTAFLQVLVNGPTKLYYSRDLSVAGQFYIQKPNEPVVQLQRNYYRSILDGLLNDCDELKIEQGSALERKVSYSVNGLSPIITAYNNCRYPAENSRVLVVAPKIKLRLGARAGGHYSRPGSTGSAHHYKQYAMNGEAGFTAGVFANANFMEKISLQPELLYTTRRIETTYEYINPTDIGYKDYALAEAKYIQVPVLVQYTFGKGALQPYVNAGISYSFLVDKKMHRQIKYDSGYTYFRELDLDNKMLGFAAGAGVQQRLNSNLLLTAGATL